MRALLIVAALAALTGCNTWKGAGDDLSSGYHGAARDETPAQKLDRESRSEAGMGGMTAPDHNENNDAL